jgi:hypothetical protein
MTHALRRVPALVAAALCLGLLVPAGQSVAADDAPPAAPEPGRPWFGPGLDWEEDRAEDYAARLGATPSLYAQRVNYPLLPDDVSYLELFAVQAAAQGSVAALVLEPRVALAELSDDHAAALGDELAALHDDLGTHFLVRFAPEMNGWWTTWGQQPDAYVDAFRTVADAVHEATDHAEMVWAPVYGAGYPFGRALTSPDSRQDRADRARLDTDGDGRLGDGDDPYGPYFPGDRWVDWVGLHMYRYGGRSNGNNAAPRPGEVEARLEDRFRYSVAARRPSFYDRFARPGRPMLIETAALHQPSNTGGDSERAVKERWWRQLLAATGDRPAIGAISWLELARPEEEIDGELADWRVTHRPALAAALRSDLASSGLVLGPVTGAVEPADDGTDDASDDASVDDTGDDTGDAGGSAGDEVQPGVVTIGPLTPGWIVLIVVSLAVLYSTVRSLARRRRAG